MTTWIALLRGVNVGGHNKLPMKELRATAAGLGFADPRTYIQSGNLVFEADADDPAELGARLADAVSTGYGIRTRALVLSRDDLAAALAANPFPEAEPNRLHLWFLAVSAALDPAVLDALAASDERWALAGRVAYLHAPGGLGRSKLAASMERLLDVDATARNMRTVAKVLGLADQS